MKTINLFNQLKADGFNDIQIIGKDVKVNIGFMAKKALDNFASEHGRFDDLKFSLMNWASIHGTSCKREGGAMIVYGE